MYPVLFKIGGVPIFTYGLLVALGFFAGILCIKYEAIRLGENPEKILDLCFYSIVSAIIGSRIFYIFTDPGPFIADPWEMLRFWNGGLVFYGGFIAVCIVSVIFIRINKMKFLRTFDIGSPAVALGHSIGRLGCFFAGCCHGRACSLPWAVTFRAENSLAPLHIPLHPTQLYESFSNFILFGVLFFLRKKTRFEGQLFCLYMILYAGVRMVNETFRGDFRGHFGIGFLSPSQSIGLVVILFFSGLMVVLSRRSRKGGGPPCPKSD